jgi:hypothetical protein
MSSYSFDREMDNAAAASMGVSNIFSIAAGDHDTGASDS